MELTIKSFDELYEQALKVLAAYWQKCAKSYSEAEERRALKDIGNTLSACKGTLPDCRGISTEEEKYTELLKEKINEYNASVNESQKINYSFVGDRIVAPKEDMKEINKMFKDVIRDARYAQVPKAERTYTKIVPASLKDRTIELIESYNLRMQIDKQIDKQIVCSAHDDSLYARKDDIKMINGFRDTAISEAIAEKGDVSREVWNMPTEYMRELREEIETYNATAEPGKEIFCLMHMAKAQDGTMQYSVEFNQSDAKQLDAWINDIRDAHEHEEAPTK